MTKDNYIKLLTEMSKLVAMMLEAELDRVKVVNQIDKITKIIIKDIEPNDD